MATDFLGAAELSFDEIAIGQAFEATHAFTADDVLVFARVSGDFSPLHVDPEYAATTEFGSQVVHGILVASLFSRLVGMQVPGRRALYLGQDLTFRRPVLIGEAIRAVAKVTAKSDATRTLVLGTEIRSADDKVIVSGTAKVKVRDDAPVAAGATAAVPVAADPGRRVALVTGASRGIGAEIARCLARAGNAVAVNYFQSADRAARVVDEIRAAGGTAIAVQADVRDPEAVAAMLATVAEQVGPPSVVVNTAIGEFNQRPLDDLRWSDFLAQMEYQVKAVLQVCQATRPHMKAAGGGVIVNLLSQVVAEAPPAGVADYVAAKYALEGLSKAMAAEWADDRVRVNMVSPGLTRTDLTEHYQERVFKMEAAKTPLRRLSTPEDIANAVCYLAGDQSSFLTGVNLFVTGGQVML